MPSRRKTSELATLADRLIVRHLRVSLAEPRTRQNVQRRCTPEPLLERRVRCIAIVGAGASSTLFARGEKLATELEQEFMSEYEDRRAELFRLQRVYGLDPDHFETRLAAISRTPEGAQRVRQLIASRYNYRHPTILAYELLAHLLKHRFLDAIITFNFDEILDQSLDDELGAAEYRRLVSDRDCTNVVSDPDADDYLPIYIKLHGTAAEPESLRFTRESYYELPRKLTEVVEGLVNGQHCVIANVGSGMAGFDLHRLLRIPEQLEIYDLSKVPLDTEVCDAISAERCEPKGDSLFPQEERVGANFGLLTEEEPLSSGRRDCDGWMKSLVDEITRRSGASADPKRLAHVVRFRSVDRHEALADVMGAEASLSRWTIDPEKHRNDYVDYLRRRTIIELAFSGAKARGLAQVSWLAVDRCGEYYDRYRSEAIAAGEKVLSWRDLRSAAGLAENGWLPDVVEAQPDLCARDAGDTYDNGLWKLREFVPKALAAQVVNQIGNSNTQAARLTRALKELQAGSEIEIHSTDDHVCAKTFDAPLVLSTVTALRVFTMELFTDSRPEDQIYISCETGEWLLEDHEMMELLARHEKIEVITAFELKKGELKTTYGDDGLTLKSINPWRHNRHMTIVCRGNTPMRAVYFARRLRTPLITPVYLGRPDDAARVMKTFELMRHEIEEEQGLAVVSA
jgi:hypothetical protein